MTDYALELDDAAVRRFVVAARHAEQAERDQWAAAGIRPGAIVADIGCGPGAVSVVLARQVEPGGRVLAVDGDPAALAAARRVASASGAENVEFSEGDAAATGLAPGTADVVMMRHVLGHNGGRQQEIVNHVRSVLRPGGCVYLVDTDLTALRMYPPDPAMDDMWRTYCDFQFSRGNDVSAGLGLGDLIRRAGLELAGFRGRYDIFSEKGFKGPAWEARDAMSEAGFAGPEDFARWQEAIGRRDAAEDTPAIFLPIFTATGRLSSQPG